MPPARLQPQRVPYGPDALPDQIHAAPARAAAPGHADRPAGMGVALPLGAPLLAERFRHETACQGDDPTMRPHDYRFAGDGLLRRAGARPAKRYLATACVSASCPLFNTS